MISLLSYLVECYFRLIVDTIVRRRFLSFDKKVKLSAFVTIYSIILRFRSIVVSCHITIPDWNSSFLFLLSDLYPLFHWFLIYSETLTVLSRSSQLFSLRCFLCMLKVHFFNVSKCMKLRSQSYQTFYCVFTNSFC